MISPNFSSRNQKLTIHSKDEGKKECFLRNFIFGFNLEIIEDRFILYKEPNSNPPSEGYPVIFLFHGAVEHAFSWFIGLNLWSISQTSFTKSALENGYFIVSFESKKPIRPGPRAWNSFEKDIAENYDIYYVKNVISWLENLSLNINLDNIYCAGFSSGAFFCSRLAQSFDYDFKGFILNSDCNANCIKLSPKGPMFNCSTGFSISSFHPPTLLVHGEKDSIVPFECAESYYRDLKNSNIDVKTLFDEKKDHIWLKNFNSEILNWMNSQ